MRGLTGLLLAALLVGCGGHPAPPAHQPSHHHASPTSSPRREVPSPVLPTRPTVGPVSRTSPGTVAHLLARVRLVTSIGYHPGYDRACDPGACVFGEEWTDDNPTRTGHDGCDTRQDVLLAQMRHVETRWGDACRIYQATLTDPYTGRHLTWRQDGYDIQIDHVYPLATAWYAGAWAWPPARRLAFANDVDRELLAVWGPANQAKLAAGPAAWLPRAAYVCGYLAKYLGVAVHYDLPITTADASAVERSGCLHPSAR